MLDFVDPAACSVVDRRQQRSASPLGQLDCDNAGFLPDGTGEPPLGIVLILICRALKESDVSLVIPCYDITVCCGAVRLERVAPARVECFVGKVIYD